MNPSAPMIETFGTTPSGEETKLFTLTNRHGLKARVSNYGALLIGVETPDRDGVFRDIVLGFDHFPDWLVNEPHFGATIGRFANRIAAGRFTLDGGTYSLALNNDPGGIPCHLHGGLKGFDKAVWEVVAASADSVTLRHVSPAGDEGYPGALTATVTYTLNDDNELIWYAEAVTDAPTIVNMALHAYWNLSGDHATKILDHELTLEADAFLPTNVGLIPTGEILPVAGTPMDFTSSAVIGSQLDFNYGPIHLANGFDHCWVLRPGTGIRPTARVRDPKTGRVMEVLTDQPGVQFYDATYLDGNPPGKGGVRSGSCCALCLETENFPDAPNHPAFPSAVLRPGETYRHTLVHRFSVD